MDVLTRTNFFLSIVVNRELIEHCTMKCCILVSRGAKKFNFNKIRKIEVRRDGTEREREKKRAKQKTNSCATQQQAKDAMRLNVQYASSSSSSSFTVNKNFREKEVTNVNKSIEQKISKRYTVRCPFSLLLLWHP